MRVMLDERYGIGSDENNFVLFEVKVKGSLGDTGFAGNIRY